MIVLAVDGNSILNRAYFGIRVLNNSKGFPTNALTGFTNILTRHIESLSPDRLVIAFDKKAPTFRHLMYDGYKSNRKGMPDELALQLPYAKNIAKYLGFYVLEQDGIEADDILGTTAKLCEKHGDFCYILTGDRDSLQLIDDKNAAVLLAGNSDTVTYNEKVFFEKYMTSPKGLIDIKALMGDSSDCIPGVKGIGEKTAISLISQYNNLDNVYENIETLPIGPSAKEKIRNDKDMAYLSKELATIKVDCDISLNLDDRLSFDKEELKKLLTELEMFGVLKKVNSMKYFQGEYAEETFFENSERCKVVSADLSKLNELFGGDLVAISMDDNCIYACNDMDAVYKIEIENNLKILAENVNKICIYDAKQLYKLFIDNNVPFENTVKFDVSICAYLVNSGVQKVDIERLASLYLHIIDEDTDKARECEISYKLYPILLDMLEKSEQSKLFYEIELPLTKVIADMENCGFYVDKDELQKFGESIDAEIEGVENQIYFMTDEQFNINSPKQLGVVLFEHMGLPCKKKSKTGYSTDAETLEALAPYYEVIDKILEYRMLTKLKSTYVDGMIKVISEKDGRIHSSFNQTVTATGRLSSTEPNLQNIPIRTAKGRELRKFFKAKDGYVLIDADYSQIELRLLAVISNDSDFKEAFIKGEDIHRATASSVFGVPYDAVSSELRGKAKAVNFGIVYGISAFSLSGDIGTSVADAKKYIESYLGKYKGVSNYLNNIVAKAREKGYVTTVFGRRRYVPELSSPKKPIQSFGERVAKNSPIQGTAADIIKLAMVNVHKKLQNFKDAKLLLQVHDELIIEAPEEEAIIISDMLKSEMENVCNFDVPLSAEVKYAKNWYDAK